MIVTHFLATFTDLPAWIEQNEIATDAPTLMMEAVPRPQPQIPATPAAPAAAQLPPPAPPAAHRHRPALRAAASRRFSARQVLRRGRTPRSPTCSPHRRRRSVQRRHRRHRATPPAAIPVAPPPTRPAIPAAASPPPARGSRGVYARVSRDSGSDSPRLPSRRRRLHLRLRSRRQLPFRKRRLDPSPRSPIREAASRRCSAISRRRRRRQRTCHRSLRALRRRRHRHLALLASIRSCHRWRRIRRRHRRGRSAAPPPDRERLQPALLASRPQRDARRSAAARPYRRHFRRLLSTHLRRSASGAAPPAPSWQVPAPVPPMPPFAAPAHHRVRRPSRSDHAIGRRP